MLFCPNCGTRLALVRDKQDLNSITQYSCPKCGYVKSDSSSINDNTITKSNISKEVIIVFDEKEPDLRTMSTSRAECQKCHNDLAYIWQVQTRSGDEGATQFFRCTKCSHTWRLYT